MYSVAIERLGLVLWQDSVQIPVTKWSWLSIRKYSTGRRTWGLLIPGRRTQQRAYNTQPSHANVISIGWFLHCDWQTLKFLKLQDLPLSEHSAPTSVLKYRKHLCQQLFPMVPVFHDTFERVCLFQIPLLPLSDSIIFGYYFRPLSYWMAGRK